MNVFLCLLLTENLLHNMQRPALFHGNGPSASSRIKYFIRYLKPSARCELLSENARKASATDDRNDLLEIM